MALLQKLNRKVLKIGKDSTGLIFPKPFIASLEWFQEGDEVSIELHSDENNQTHIIIKRIENE